MKLQNVFWRYTHFISSIIDSPRAYRAYRYLLVGLALGLAVGLGAGIVIEGAADLHYTTREQAATAQRWEAERQQDLQQSTIEGRSHEQHTHY